MKSKIILGHIYSFICVFIWGTTFLSTKVLLNSFDPVGILIYRLGICLILLCIIHPKLYKLNRKRDELLFLGAGASGICFYFLFENFALEFTSASNVGIIVSMAPMFTMLFCSLILKNTKIKINFIIGFVVAIVGVILISINGSKSFGLSPKGDILAILAMVMWGIYSVFISLINMKGYGGIGSTRKIMIYGFLCFIPFIFIMDAKFNFSALGDMTNLLNILYLGICASTIAFILWNKAVEDIGPVTTSIYLYLSPAITLIASIIILNERFNYLSIIGLVLSVIGLVISNDVLIYRLKRKTLEN